MKLLLPLLIGLRFSRARKQSSMSRFISFASVMGVAIGVAVLIIGLSAMNGFEKELNHRVLGLTPSAEIISSVGPVNESSVALKILDEYPKVIAVAPNIILNGLISNDTVFKPIQVRAIDPAKERQVLGIEEFIQNNGSLDLLSDVTNTSNNTNDTNNNVPNGIIVGDLTAKKLGVSIGDSVEFIIAKQSENGAISAPVGTMFTVKGIFKIGGQLDGLIAFIHIDTARNILGWGKDSASQFSVKVENIFEAHQNSYEAARYLVNLYPGSYYVQSWMMKNGHLYRDIQMVRSILYLALVLIVAVACFNIISSLIMAVNDKRSEVAILMSMGYRASSVMYTFIVNGIMSGCTGAFLGTVVGLLLAYNLTDVITFLQNIFGFQLLKQEVYFINFIPSVVHLTDVALVVGVALVLTLIATLIPSYMSTRINPARELSGK